MRSRATGVGDSNERLRRRRRRRSLATGRLRVIALGNGPYAQTLDDDARTLLHRGRRRRIARAYAQFPK